MGFDIGNILKTVAPFIASALPGPLGAGAKLVLSEVFGIGKDSSDTKIQDAIANATPEQIAKLTEAENSFKERMTALGYANVEKLEELANAEMASARAREVELARAGMKDHTPMILAFAAVAGFTAVLIFVLTANIDTWGQTKVGIVTGLLGTLTTIVVMIFGYYFGSSKGSTDKTTMMSKLTGKT